MSTSPDEARNLTLLSVVVPCLDEEQVIRETNRRLVSALGATPGLDFEIIYVDDGSQDSTLDILRELQQVDQRVRIVSLSRNFGQFAALTAGMQHAVGDAVAIIDADLQDPPEVIPEMLELWQRGVDIVRGFRTNRPGENRFKLWSSRAFMSIFNKLSETKLSSGVGEFGVVDRAAVDAFLNMPESQRYLRGMMSWLGFRQETFPFEREVRLAGQTKYSLKKLTKLAINSILSFSIAPLRVIIWIGFLLSVFAFLGIIYIIISLFTDTSVSGWVAISILALTLGSLQLISLGIIGEYLGRIYGEAKRRPLYLVRERLGFAPEYDGE